MYKKYYMSNFQRHVNMLDMGRLPDCKLYFVEAQVLYYIHDGKDLAP